MVSYRAHKFLATGIASMALLAVLSGCGSSPQDNAASGAGTATATCTPRATTITRASGVVQSASSDALVITKQDGSSITTTLSDKTIFNQQALVDPSALTSGSFVTIAVTQNPDGSTYTADTIQLTTGTTGGFPGRGGFGGGQNGGPGGGQNGGSGNGKNPCRPPRNGTPGANGGFGGGAGGGGGQNGNAGNRLFGTVAQVSGNTLVVTDASNNNYSLTLTSKTQIIQTQKVTASALKVGQNVSIIGSSSATAGSTKVTATTVTVMISPTPAASGA